MLEKEEKKENAEKTEDAGATPPATQPMPAVPLRGKVLFPCVNTVIIMGREKSIAAVHRALEGEVHEVFFVTQRSDNDEAPVQSDLYTLGVIAEICTPPIKEGGGNVRVGVKGLRRAEMVKFYADGDCYLAEVSVRETVRGSAVEEEAAYRSLKDSFSAYCAEIPAGSL